MKIEYISHNPGCRSLILVYAGWSTSPSLYQDIEITGWDVAVVYDYSDLSVDLSFLEGYNTVWLFAWSLGVRMAAASLPPEKITAAFAINGTLSPVSDTEGIPPKIYNATADNLDERNLKKFQRRMTPDSDVYHRLFERDFTDGEVLSLKKQLYGIRDLAAPNAEIPWRRAYLGCDDRIFPFQNMERHWKHAGIQIVKTDGAHYLPLAEIVRSVIPDCGLIAKKFSKASDTYDSNATAQREIAGRLAAMLNSLPIPPRPKILEIGPGTGLFTRAYAGRLKPGTIDFVDIAPVQPMHLAETERYFCEDAEKWVRLAEEKYDCILSSSTIQWFANIPEFINNCSRLLRPGGVILMSGFAKGNLGELDSLRPSPIHYHSPEEYQKWFERNFYDTSVLTEEITLCFSSPRELMMHLKHTGVGGSAPSPGISPSALRAIDRITYRPIYISATKRK